MLTVDFGTPSPPQERFLKDTHRYVCYGGAKGGGKTHIVRVKSTILACAHDGIKILVMRQTIVELRNNYIIPMLKMVGQFVHYNAQEHIFTFPNGSTITCGYCSCDRDLTRYQGHEYDVLFLDEATTFMYEWFFNLDLCVRGANDFIKRTYLTCNPGGIGHTWVKRLFIDREFEEEESPEDYSFIPARVTDNKALMTKDPGYVKRLMALPPEQRAAKLDGNWESFEGRFFPEFREMTHVVDPFPIPEHWRRYRSIDYGLDMLAVLWVAISPEGDEYVYRELNAPDLPAAAAAEAIREHTGNEYIYATYAPPDLWSRTKDSGITVAELFRTNGVPFTQASNDRINGWQAVKDRIKIMKPYAPEKPVKETAEDLIYAASPNYQAWKAVEAAEAKQTPEIHSKLRVFQTCPTLIKHTKSLQYDEDRIGDASTEPHDITHATDSLRYYCVSRTFAPKPDKPVTPNAAEQLRRRLAQSRSRRIRAT